MSGHSKWSTIKRKKAVVDAKRGKVFTRHTREIITAAREGGGDPTSNNRLRAAISGAKAVNMPNTNIEKAVKRGTGEIEGAMYEESSYEGYGPGGVALFIDTLTDNKNRTVSEVRHALSKHGGSLGENGCVGWMFDLKGVIVIDSTGRDEEEVMELVVEVGAEDFELQDDVYQITTESTELMAAREALEGKGVEVKTAELTRIPQNTVDLDVKDGQKMLRLMEALEDLDDVQRVSANFDIPDELLQSMEG